MPQWFEHLLYEGSGEQFNITRPRIIARKILVLLCSMTVSQQSGNCTDMGDIPLPLPMGCVFNNASSIEFCVGALRMIIFKHATPSICSLPVVCGGLEP